MTIGYTFPPRLKLLFDHLKAVRTLNEYVTGIGLKKDMQDLVHHLQQDLSRDVFRPAGWEDLYASKGYLYSSPRSGDPENQLVPKWGVVEGDFIAIEISPGWPVLNDDEDAPYAELYVPEHWEQRRQFIAELKTPPGFEHVNQYPDGELEDTTSVFKYVRYENYVAPDGRFDGLGFIEAFREATKTLVAMEMEVDQILERLNSPFRAEPRRRTRDR